MLDSENASLSTDALHAIMQLRALTDMPFSQVKIYLPSLSFDAWKATGVCVREHVCVTDVACVFVCLWWCYPILLVVLPNTCRHQRTSQRQIRLEQRSY